MKNRIINGAMVIDQRNAGGSVTPSNNQYLVDRWMANLSASSKYSVQQNAGSVTPPAGFRNYLGVTSLSSYSLASGDYHTIRQYIEGYNTSDLMWGTSNAKTVTLSFWVYSSLTGSFGGVITNENNDRGYPFLYTISSANTWQYITVTIPGDTTGTWPGATNGVGLRVLFQLGTGTTYSATAGSWQSGVIIGATGAVNVLGTNGATWYITGVQLEAGSVASQFEYRQYGTELHLCQRYFQKTFQQSIAPAQNAGYGATCLLWNSSGSNNAYGTQIQWRFPVIMRAAPTVTYYNPSAANANARNAAITADMTVYGSPIGTSPLGESSIQFVAGDTASGPGHCCVIHAAVSAEL
jgi:hypothetical protein